MPSDTAIAVDLAPGQGLRVPRHLGVIMDGNGRWAMSRGKQRTEGHLEGVKALRRLVELCIRYRVGYLTVFSFSSENWRRPKDEVNFIFGLLHRFVASDLASLIRNNVRVTIIGRRDDLSGDLLKLIDEVESRTARNTGLNLIVAFNYGGRAEITEAVKRIAAAVADGHLKPGEITEDTVTDALFTSGVPDPDLIIRTSGERRLSNFLLWQGAYSELVFVEENWPDFTEETFLRVLGEFAGRDRRFGGIASRGS